MRQKRIIVCIILILAATAALLFILHQTDGSRTEQGQVEILLQEKKLSISGTDIARVPVMGELVNGKGERVPIDAKGSLLSDVLISAGIDPAEVSVVRITAQDEFSAEVSGEELREADRVYLISGDDGAVTLVVFGDSNAKRNVRNVARIEVNPQ